MEHTPASRLEALRQWIKSATKDLTRGACKRLDEEFRDHYQTIVEEALESGDDEESAHEVAMASLGSSFETQIASLVVHGDPHRLRVKAGILVCGLVVCFGALWYADSLSMKNHYFKQGLYNAVLSGDVSLVKKHLDYGVNPNDTHRSILHLALGRDYAPGIAEQMVQLLLEYGADPNTEDVMGRIPLFYLVIRYHEDEDYFRNRRESRWDIMDILLESGMKLSSQSKLTYWTPIQYASSVGDHEMIEKLESLGVESDWEALIYQQKFDEAKTKIDQYPGIFDEESYSRSIILKISISRCDKNFAEYLFEKSMSPLERGKFGRDALYFYFRNRPRKDSPFDLEVLRLLLEKGCDPTRKENRLDEVFEFNYVEIDPKVKDILSEYGYEFISKKKEDEIISGLAFQGLAIRR